MNKTIFSGIHREAILEETQNEQFDLIVIGGGITGAGIALDATARGLKVMLVEKKDFAWGTSSRSTKLIHGGLRYLKQLEIRLVREVGLERAIVHQNARHIVIPEKMLLPIIEGGELGKMTSSVALWVYDYLADVDKEERRKMLSKEETLKHEPLLREDVLKGGGIYYEYRTDDARLTIENLKSARARGAKSINYTEAVEYFYENGKISGVRVKDHFTNKLYDFKAKKIVNATGPWVDEVRGLDDAKLGKKRLHLTKGVHVVVPYKKLPIQQAVYFDVDGDSRMVFAIPRGRVTYVGTTDTTYKSETDEPYTTKSDVEYVLAAANYMFPNTNLTADDVVSTWAGLRPLIHQQGKDPSELSRKDEIFYAESGLISIAGGKLTGYRKMAERVVNEVVKFLQKENPDQYKNLQPCTTAKIQLSGGEFDSQRALETFIIKRIGEVKQIGLKENHVIDLVYKYGTNVDIIIEKAYELYAEISDAEQRIQVAEMWYGIHYEMCNNLCDYLVRRTGRLYFERDSLAKLYPFIADEMAKEFGWNEAQKAAAIAEFEKEYMEVVTFNKEEKLATTL